MATTEIPDRRRTLRYRHLLVRQMVQMKNQISGLLMETGVSHNKQLLHKIGYFRELLSSNQGIDESIRPLLRLSREAIVRLQKTEYALVSSLQRDPLLAEPGQTPPDRSRRWFSSPPSPARVGASHFRSVKQAISYRGLCSDEKSSAEKTMRTHFPNSGTSTSSERLWRPRSSHLDRATSWPWFMTSKKGKGMRTGRPSRLLVDDRVSVGSGPRAARRRASRSA